MASLSAVSEELAEIDGQISDNFRALSNGFQKLEKIKDSNRQSRQLEELTEKMRECKRLIKEFDRELKDLESKNAPETNKTLAEKKQSMIKELNSYVALKKQYASNLENKRVDLFEGPGEGFAEENVLLTSNMTNQQLMDNGNHMMNETDQAIDRAKKVVHDTIDVGTETAAALKAQTEQMSRIVNELDSIHFSIKKASQLVKEIGRQVATDRCIMGLLFLIVVGVIVIIIVKFLGLDATLQLLAVVLPFLNIMQKIVLKHVNYWAVETPSVHMTGDATDDEIVNPHNKDIRDIPGLAPPAPTRKLLWNAC